MDKMRLEQLWIRVIPVARVGVSVGGRTDVSGYAQASVGRAVHWRTIERVGPSPFWPRRAASHRSQLPVSETILPPPPPPHHHRTDQSAIRGHSDNSLHFKVIVFGFQTNPKMRRPYTAGPQIDRATGKSVNSRWTNSWVVFRTNCFIIKKKWTFFGWGKEYNFIM